MPPGTRYGFTAEELGSDTSDRAAFWRTEVGKVRDPWTGAPR